MKKRRQQPRTKNRSSGGKELEYPDIELLEKELNRERQRSRFVKTLVSLVGTLVVVAAVAILVTTLLVPVLQVTGNSMSPTFQQGDILIAYKTDDFTTGDLIAFYYNNKILVKRVIARAGDWVDIDDEGNVYVNDVVIEEPYISEKDLGDCNIDLPYQVPESRVFVMGDNRSVSIDSRNTSVGCVSSEQIVGKIEFRVWPFEHFGIIDGNTAE